MMSTGDVEYFVQDWVITDRGDEATLPDRVTRVQYALTHNP